MKQLDHFIFFDDTAPGNTDAFVVEIPARISNAIDLLRIISEKARFPKYFGGNWNALADCLRDFHWVTSREIILHHVDLPELPPADLHAYLDVLVEAVTSWSPGEEHVVRAAFPNSVKPKIAAAFRASGSPSMEP